jgi:cobalamin synthase
VSRRILAELLRPDAQPRDWYGWLTNQAGHAALVGQPAALALMIAGVPAWASAAIVAAVYLALWERLIQRGRDWADSLTDTASVGAGAALLATAVLADLPAAVFVLAFWAALLVAGVGRRLAETPPSGDLQ